MSFKAKVKRRKVIYFVRFFVYFIAVCAGVSALFVWFHDFFKPVKASLYAVEKINAADEAKIKIFLNRKMPYYIGALQPGNDIVYAEMWDYTKPALLFWLKDVNSGDLAKIAGSFKKSEEKIKYSPVSGNFEKGRLYGNSQIRFFVYENSDGLFVQAEVLNVLGIELTGSIAGIFYDENKTRHYKDAGMLKDYDKWRPKLNTAEVGK